MKVFAEARYLEVLSPAMTTEPNGLGATTVGADTENHSGECRSALVITADFRESSNQGRSRAQGGLFHFGCMLARSVDYRIPSTRSRINSTGKHAHWRKRHEREQVPDRLLPSLLKCAERGKKQHSDRPEQARESSGLCRAIQAVTYPPAAAARNEYPRFTKM